MTVRAAVERPAEEEEMEMDRLEYIEQLRRRAGQLEPLYHAERAARAALTDAAWQTVPDWFRRSVLGIAAEYYHEWARVVPVDVTDEELRAWTPSRIASAVEASRVPGAIAGISCPSIDVWRWEDNPHDLLVGHRHTTGTGRTSIELRYCTYGESGEVRVRVSRPSGQYVEGLARVGIFGVVTGRSRDAEGDIWYRRHELAWHRAWSALGLRSADDAGSAFVVLPEMGDVLPDDEEAE